MAKHLRYYTEFLSKEGHTIRAEILQEASSAFSPLELGIGSGESPLTITWSETDKIEPIQGSTATLIVNSASDRQLLHLASVVEVGEVRLDVYRDNLLWWSGTLDSEPYEEPYTSASNYDVSLVFSDFGALNRIKWSRTGRESFEDILTACLTASGINYIRREDHISTHESYYASGALIDLARITLNNGNFYDEEGEALSGFEVLKGILQPFALRVIQRAGIIHLYDINCVASMNAEDVEWAGNDAAISHDAVYNNATVRFSPYAEDTIIEGNVTVNERLTEGRVIKTSYDALHPDDVLDGFRVRYGGNIIAEGVTVEHDAVMFEIESAYSGSDASGVLWCLKAGDDSLDGGSCRQLVRNAQPCFYQGDNINIFVGEKIATFPLQYLNYVTPVSGVREQFKLRLNLDLLFDVRYNPFEEAGKYNEKDNYDKMMDKCKFVYVPIMVRLLDAPGGNCLYHLANSGLVHGDKKYSAPSGTRWVSGDGNPGCLFLAYYDHEDRKSKIGVGGWSTNRRCIGAYRDELPDSWSKMEAGEYVSLPPAGGYLEFSIYSGFHIRNRNIVTSIYDYVRWVAYKDAKITLVKKNGLAIEMCDQEDTAHINSYAQEEYSVDTIIGTPSDNVPAVTGRGIIYNSFSMMAEKFTRGDVHDRLEKLLLGTIYSQYAERKLKLSGTIKLLSPIVLGDSPRINGKFLLVADNQNLYEDTSEVVMTEFGPDEYRDIAYE